MSKKELMELSLRIQLAIKYCEEGKYNKQDIIKTLSLIGMKISTIK